MRALVVTVPPTDVEEASDMLWQLGVRGIEERSGELAGDESAIELWTAVGDEPSAIERAVVSLGDRWSHRVVDVDDPTSDAWRAFSSPTWIDDTLVIVPAWTAFDAQEAGPEARTTVVRIEPGAAFGLGDHPTTIASLRAVRRLVGGGDAGLDVLDVGCGTGVIAVTVAVLQGRRVRAVDIADAAVEATLGNARTNGVADLVTVDSHSVAELDGGFDVVVANILAPTLVSMAPDLRRLTRPDGRLVISGILAGSHRHVLDSLEPMQVERTDVLDGWACVVLRHDQVATSRSTAAASGSDGTAPATVVANAPAAHA